MIDATLTNGIVSDPILDLMANTDRACSKLALNYNILNTPNIN
jgi:hypothetical protein